MPSSNYKPQTGDPGENHAVHPGKVTGMIDFGGQDGYDERSEEGVGDDTEVPVRATDTSNPLNGSGGSQRVIDPSRVRGTNP